MEEDKKYNLLVVTFEGKGTAKEAMKVVKKLKKEKALELVDVVAASKGVDGKVKLTQGKELTASKGALYFGTASLVAGTLLGGPLAFAALGAAAGGAAGKLSDSGFDNKVLKDLAAEMDRDTSALLLVATDVDFDKTEGSFSDFGGKLRNFMLAGENFVALGNAAGDFYAAVVEDDMVEEVEVKD